VIYRIVEKEVIIAAVVHGKRLLDPLPPEAPNEQ
jgi:hypothetical protein